jgi:tetrahydromethanopterin S-methyltransferase subunit G
MPQERRSAAKAISRQLVGEIRNLKQRSKEILRRLDEIAREVETVKNKASRRAGHQT